MRPRAFRPLIGEEKHITVGSTMGNKSVSLLLFLCCFLAVRIHAEGSPDQGTYPVPGWRWSTEAGNEAIEPGFDDSGWASVEDGSRAAPVSAMKPFWLRARVSLADLEAIRSSSPDGELYFLTGMSGCVADVYVNGSYIGSRSSSSPRYNLRSTHTDVLLIPSALLSQGDALAISLRCVYNGTSFLLPSYALADRAAAGRISGSHNFWNGEFYTMLAFLCAFLGFYFLFMFAGKTQMRENLFFGISLVLLAFYFYEMGSAYLPFGSPVVKALGRGSLTVSIIFLFRFFARFFARRDSRIVNIGALVLAAGFYAAFLLAAGDEDASTMVFNIGLLPVFFTIVYGLVAAIIAVRRKQTEAIPLLVGMVVGSAFAVHDIYYQALGRTPFAWLQGLTFFFLDAAIFVMLSMRQTRLSKQLETFAKDLEEGKEELESSLARMEKAGNAAAEIGRELEGAVSTVAKATESSEARTAAVDAETEELARSAVEADGLLAKFIASIDRINERLTEESAGIEQTAAAATELQAGIENSAQSIEKTSAFAESLAELTAEGHRAADALGGAMDRIAGAARGIGEVVDAVNEFAERTNLLAMNASIEAAHSGQAGKGFGVIAGEVKKLAAAQGERARRISELAAEIGTRLADGAAESARMRSALSRIAEDAKGAAQRMAEARTGAGEQARASAEVRDAMKSLAESVSAIREEAGMQSAYSARVREAVAGMVAGANDARGSAAAIAKEGADIARSVRELDGLARRSLSLTEDLKRKLA